MIYRAFAHSTAPVVFAKKYCQKTKYFDSRQNYMTKGKPLIYNTLSEAARPPIWNHVYADQTKLICLRVLKLIHSQPERDFGERTVFFEADTRAEAYLRLRALLAALWTISPESVDFYNLKDEAELIAESIGGAETDDHRFFEVGMAHGQAMYIGGSGHPLMFLHQSLDRMMAAYFTLPHRGETGLRIHLCKFD